jgi:uracil-DNA glycosylase
MPDEILRRRSMLREPHIAALTAYVETLRARHPEREFQDFDPYDGGTLARVLFLMEKPGPKTSQAGGSGFISRDNDDATAEAIFTFMRDAKIPREQTVLWNVIPGWNGKIKVTADEWREGLAELANLFALLPRLDTVVLVGRKARRAEAFVQGRGLRVITSAHPSPKVKATNRQMWERIRSDWAAAQQEAPGWERSQGALPSEASVSRNAPLS